MKRAATSGGSFYPRPIVERQKARTYEPHMGN
jgi:hypothetical protein